MRAVTIDSKLNPVLYPQRLENSCRTFSLKWEKRERGSVFSRPLKAPYAPEVESELCTAIEDHGAVHPLHRSLSLSHVTSTHTHTPLADAPPPDGYVYSPFLRASLLEY